MKNLYKALHTFQGQVDAVARNATNPHFKNRYATFENVCDTIRPHMQECGLIWSQMPSEVSEMGLSVKTVIAHVESGEAIETVMVVPLSKRDAQGAGSALTYGMRYSLMAMLGLPPTDDDDGNLGSQKQSAPPQEKPASKAQARDPYKALQAAIAAHTSPDKLSEWWISDETKRARAALPADWHETLKVELADHGRALKANAAKSTSNIEDTF
jgi:hypothetical protein